MSITKISDPMPSQSSKNYTTNQPFFSIFSRTILHSGEDFSNLSRIPRVINFSLAIGYAITAAYVPPAQGIKSHIVHPNELHRTQPTETKSTETDFAATNPTG